MANKAEWADIDAIRDYINRFEGELRKTAAGAKVVEDFRVWYGQLNIIDQTMRVVERVSEAKWYREQANRILGKAVLDPSTYPASDAPPAATDPTPKAPLIPTWLKVAGVVLGGIGLYKLFSAHEEE